jgi:hypothetical protein
MTFMFRLALCLVLTLATFAGSAEAQWRRTYPQQYQVRPAAPTGGTLGQYVPNPPDDSRKWFTVIYHDGSARGEQVVQWFQQHKELASLRQNTHFVVYSPAHKMWTARYADHLGTAVGVSVMDPTGGVYYKATGTLVPATPEGLTSEIRYYLSQSTRWTRDNEGRWYCPSDQPEQSQCPDGCGPQPKQPDRLIPKLIPDTVEIHPQLQFPGLDGGVIAIVVVIGLVLVVGLFAGGALLLLVAARRP